MCLVEVLTIDGHGITQLACGSASTKVGSYIFTYGLLGIVRRG